MSKPLFRVVCDKCGAAGVPDTAASSQNWAVYKTCACGGRLQARLVLPEPKMDEEVEAYLRAEELDPVAIGKQGVVFAKTVLELVRLRAEVKRLRAENAVLRERLTITPEKVEAALGGLWGEEDYLWQKKHTFFNQPVREYMRAALLAAGMEEK